MKPTALESKAAHASYLQTEKLNRFLAWLNQLTPMYQLNVKRGAGPGTPEVNGQIGRISAVLGANGQDQLYGLDAPIRQEVSGPTGGPLVVADERDLPAQELALLLAAAARDMLPVGSNGDELAHANGNGHAVTNGHLATNGESTGELG